MLTPNRRFWNEQASPDSLYQIYLKKITYSSNDLPGSLQWETRQVRILKAATLDHIVEFILLLTPNQQDSEITSANHHCTSQMEEERNDVTHIIHVLFCTYRVYCSPQELFTILAKHSTRASPQQLRFVLHYWLRYYPEDYLTPFENGMKKNLNLTTTDDEGENEEGDEEDSNIGSQDGLITSTSSSSSSTTTTTSTANVNGIKTTTGTNPNHISSSTQTTPPMKTLTSSSSSSVISSSASTSSSSSTSSNSSTKANNHYTRRNGKKIENDLHIISSSSVKTKSSRKQSSSSASSSSVTSSLSASSQTSSSSLSPPSSNQKILLDLLLELPCIDDTLYRKANLFIEQHKSQPSEDTVSQTSTKSNNCNGNNPINKAPSYCIIDLDTKFVAQQLTAIDLENFLALKPYTLLNGHRDNPRVQNMIRNFNLLSKHVVVTILKAHSPDLVTIHWINIAQQLRKMRNFNSLKAVIAGLSNESVFRLKQTVWSKISKTIEATFKHLSMIVDDVDNQTLLRQTQLEIEGTAKVSFDEESFGTIPYLGTFLTDLTFIDTKLPNYIENPQEGGKRLVNLEKCCKQFEIITQLRLLQQNIKVSLFALYQSHQLSGFTILPPFYSNTNVPRIVVARLFRSWFNDSHIASMTDNDCYKLSLSLEVPSSQKK